MAQSKKPSQMKRLEVLKADILEKAAQGIDAVIIEAQNRDLLL
jgi:hypothetical protein